LSRLDLAGRSIVFVGGKGGVGKTTTAAALALQAAERGRRVLVVSTDPAHSLGDIFDMAIGSRERLLAPNLWGLEIDPEVEVGRYLDGVRATMRDFVRPAMYEEIERQIALTRHSPGAVEAALMERVVGLMDSAGGTYDLVIFDTAPTGHTLRLLILPEVMTAWMDGLLRSRERSDALGTALDRLAGRAQSPAPVPNQSSQEPHHHHHGEEEASGASDPGGEGEEPQRGDEFSWFESTDDRPQDSRNRKIREILMERRRGFARARRLLLDASRTAFVMVLIPEKLPILETEKALEVLTEHRVPVAGLIVNRVLPPEDLGDFLESRRVQEKAYLAKIDELFRRYPRIRVPLLARDAEGLDSLREVALHLGA